MAQKKLAKRFLLTTAIALCLTPVAFAQDNNAADSVEEGQRELETVVVRGRFIPEPQRETSQVASFLTSEDLLRTGDDNIALALTRLSGLSVVGGKFAYVRGLGDRYSQALLNGSPLPSPEPLRRTVPLDLFPTNVLEGTAVQKTYSANYPAEFGGGVIDIETISRPLDNYFKVKYGMGVNTATTLSDGIYVRGGDTDWLGFDDGLRDIPSAVSSIVSSGSEVGDLTDAEREILGESFGNSNLSVIQGGELGPNNSASVEFGRVYDLDNGFSFGVVGVGGYDQDWEIREATRQFAQGNSIGLDIDTVETSLTSTLNALVSASIGYDEHDVQGTIFYVHTGSKEAEQAQGFDFNAAGDGDIFDESTGWYERDLAFYQLTGDHQIFDNFDIEWRGSFAQSTRDAPYETSLRRQPNNDGEIAFLVGGPSDYTIGFSELFDESKGLGIDLSYEGEYGDGLEFVLSGGYDYSFLDREFRTLEFFYNNGNQLNSVQEVARPDFLFSPDNIGPGTTIDEVLEVGNSPSTEDFYDADLEISAGYVQGEFDLTNYIQATLGVRYEEATEAVQTSSRLGEIGATTILENDYTLPAVTLTWNFADDLQLRGGYSETVARPQFREIARSAFTDPVSNRTYRGNSGLVDSQFKNYDARLEYYLGRDQFVTLAGFYKEIERPIEEVLFSNATFVFETSFINVPKANLFGGEFEYRTKFEMPEAIPFQWMQDRDWRFSVNYTYTKSEIESGVGDTISNPLSGQPVDASLFLLDGRELQGTPENILNSQFGWEGDSDRGTLLIGWVDERILQRGLATGNPVADIIEDPGIQVDFVFGKDFDLSGRDLTLGVELRNLLDEAHEEYQLNEGELGRTEFNTYDRGRSLSASLSYKF